MGCVVMVVMALVWKWMCTCSSQLITLLQESPWAVKTQITRRFNTEVDRRLAYNSQHHFLIFSKSEPLCLCVLDTTDAAALVINAHHRGDMYSLKKHVLTVCMWPSNSQGQKCYLLKQIFFLVLRPSLTALWYENVGSAQSFCINSVQI